jgi:hypothetical protein
MKNPKSLSGFEPTAVRGKWFEVNDLSHLTTDAHKLMHVTVNKLFTIVVLRKMKKKLKQDGFPRIAFQKQKFCFSVLEIIFQRQVQLNFNLPL